MTRRRNCPTDGSRPATGQYFPPPPGFRFNFFTLGPATVSSPTTSTSAPPSRSSRERLPGMLDVLEPEHPGMHTTDTVDVDLVISGEVWLELDDGAEVHLGPGDCVVQNGTRHAWHNRTDQPASSPSSWSAPTEPPPNPRDLLQPMSGLGFATGRAWDSCRAHVRDPGLGRRPDGRRPRRPDPQR